jgi:hypothetical protein
MTIEIHRPELEALIRERLNSGAFQNAEDVIMQALRSSPAAEAPAAPPSQRPVKQKNLVDLCDPVRGLADDVDFTRTPSTARPLDL